MHIQLSNELNDIITFAKEEAVRLGNFTITTDHLVLAVLRHEENKAVDTLKALEVNIFSLKSNIEQKLRKTETVPLELSDKIVLSKAGENALKVMFLEARSMGELVPGPEHLMLAIFRGGAWSYALDFFEENKINYNRFRETLSKGREPEQAEGPRAEYDFKEEGAEQMQPQQEPQPRQRKGQKKSSSPVLDNFGYDLTRAAAEEKLDPVVGRDKEIERLAQILGRRKKNNPVLIGEPGVGKSAIAEGLAIKIAKREVSRTLRNKRIISLDIGSVVAGTKYRGQFEERMKAVLNELSKNPDIILFIDEIHTLVGAGGAAGSLDAANMLKPALARGEIQCIGATTLDEFRQFIEKDGALERRFQKIMVEPTTREQTLLILQNIKDRYQKHHNVVYTDQALKLCISLSERYITDRYLPDKAIDIMDEAGSRVHLKNLKTPKRIYEKEAAVEKFREQKELAVKEMDFRKAAMYRDLEKSHTEELDRLRRLWETRMEKHPDTVDGEDIAEAVSMATSIPVNRIAESESNKLLGMRAELEKEIIGQSEAIDKVTRAILRNRAGLKDPDKPIGTFLFLGPTGVGKTQLAKKLAQCMFDTQDALIRVDMSEYMEKHAVSRLIGAPPGYVGYDEGGQLSERVRRKPYAVVLLDEIEKAHPDIFNILLQILDEGRLTDSNGRHIDFRNTVIILTSNIGTKELKEFGNGLGYSKARERDNYEKEIIGKAIRNTFTPELLNRLDEQILFNSLTREDLEKIIEIELKGLYERVREAGYSLRITASAKKFVAEAGYDRQYGARPLKRAIRRYIEDPVAEAIIAKKAKPGESITVKLNGKKNDTTV